MTIVVQQGSSQLNQSQTDSGPTTFSVGQIENVVQNVEKFLQSDTTFPHLIDKLKGSSKCPTVSGLQDNDYPNLQEYGSGLSSLTQFTPVQTIPIPTGLQEQFDHMQQNCEMGIFTEIKRAWISIDSNLYLWAYDNGSDVAYYDALSEIIITVGLVKPKEGVFKSHIKYLLCIATSLEILLLGITFSSSDDGDNDSSIDNLLLVPDKVFSVPTDNVVMNVIKGTNDGRIFLGGKNGCVYEVVYQDKDSWFSSKCRKINHSESTLSFLIPSFIQGSREDSITQIEIDHSRHILYTLSENGTIEVYDLGENGQSMSRVLSKTLNSLVREASCFARTIDQTNFKPIIGISALENHESIHINIVAVTEAGLRLYLTTNSAGNVDERPCELSLIHIRLPPGFAACSPYQRPSYIHTSHYNKGNLILISSPSKIDNRDVLWALNSDMFAFDTDMMELCTVMGLNSKVWKMAEEYRGVSNKSYMSYNLKTKTIPIDPPSVVTQHMDEARKYILLSSQGVHIGFKPRVVDQFRQILVESQGYDNDAVKGFFSIHKKAHACAIALILACGCTSPQDAKLADWATLAFFHYGGEPSYELAQNYSIIQQQLQTPLVQSNVQHHTGFLPSVQNQPMFSSPINQRIVSPLSFSSNISPIHRTPVINPQLSESPQGSYQFSDKHDGVYLYFSRIIRSIWYTNTVRCELVVENSLTKEKFTSMISSNDLCHYVVKLSELRSFLRNNVQFSVNEEVSKLTENRYLKTSDVQARERNSLYNLLKLIEHCIEVLGLWKMLCDHQFHVISSMLPTDRQSQLKSMTFRDLFVFGNDMTTMLASCLVRRYIEDNTTTDIISNRLHEICPSIYKQENALHAKAHELVMKSKNINNIVEKNELLSKALDLCLKIGERINLTPVCELFQSVHWYEAIVNLCLTTAHKRDPQNLALHFYHMGQPNEDQQGKLAYYNRNECYRLLLEVYERLIQQSKYLISPKKSPTKSESDVELNNMTREEAKHQADKILDLAISSKDELFHISLYDWLYEHQQSDKLLEIKSPYLENYLKRKTSTLSDSIALMDLLWMYYERNGHFRAAAQILNKLAERKSSDVNLNQRIEYLSRAIVCMKSSDSRAAAFGNQTTAGEFLHELEEKMEVARIQLQIAEHLQQFHESPSVEQGVVLLNSDLLEITQLYEEFAVKFNLPECQLSILHCAGHYDPTLVETLWQKLIDNQLKILILKPKESQRAIISDKIKTLGSQYLQSEKFFPIEFIIKYLEHKTLNLSFESEWLADTLINVGVPLSRLLDLYHKIYRSNSTNRLMSIQFLKVISYIISSFIKNPSQLLISERSNFALKCLDAISKYLIDLHSLNASNDPRIRNLVMEFKSLEAKLERCL